MPKTEKTTPVNLTKRKAQLIFLSLLDRESILNTERNKLRNLRIHQFININLVKNTIADIDKKITEVKILIKEIRIIADKEEK